MQAYATPAEFDAHPTGQNVKNLYAGGTDAQQTSELAMLLTMASSALDTWCFQPLYAHTQTETRLIRPQRHGLEVRCMQFPIASVTSAKWRQTARDSWHNVDTTLIDLFGDFEAGHKYIANDQSYGYMHGFGQSPLTVQTVYVSGYANMQLTQQASAGANTLYVDNTLGVNAGDTIPIYDQTLNAGATANSYEVVTVNTVSANSFTITGTTQFTHAQNVRLGKLPPVVTLCTILTAAYLIKERRAGASVMMSGTVQPMNVVNSEDMQLVQQYMAPFRRVI